MSGLASETASETCSLTRYMALTEEKRSELREKARIRYRGSAGERQRALQYFKCLQCNLIKNPGNALQRHGIVYENGEYVLRSAA